VEVPAENRLGEEGEGFRIAMSCIDNGRYTVACTADIHPDLRTAYGLNQASERALALEEGADDFITRSGSRSRQSP
jgi:alkylation response protein AidB-like acyl-CoA dehydrogenase